MRNFALKLSFCILIFAISFYLYLQNQHTLTQLQVGIPKRINELKLIKEENRRLEYAIEQIESPDHLIDILKSDSFKNLRYPLLHEILTVQAKNVFEEEKKPQTLVSKKSGRTIILGTKP